MTAGVTDHAVDELVSVCKDMHGQHDSLAERSMAVDASSIIFGCVGSNPTAVICIMVAG